MAETQYQRTATIPIGDLRPFPGNAKRGDVATILESLARNGQYRGLVVREVLAEPGREYELTVLAGNHTLQALAAHGPGPCGLTVQTEAGELPCALCHSEPWEPAARCEVITCDDPAARRINLVDNRAADLGSYDEPALALLVAALGQDVTGTGWTDTDLADLVTAIETAYEDEPEEITQPAPAEASSTPQAPAPGPAVATAAAPGDWSPAGTTPPPPPPSAPEQVQMVMFYSPADRDETARLLTAVREVLPGAAAPEIVLRALRALAAVIDCRDAHDGVVTVAALLKAAGIRK